LGIGLERIETWFQFNGERPYMYAWSNEFLRPSLGKRVFAQPSIAGPRALVQAVPKPTRRR